MSKVIVLGLSGFNPALVERWLEDLPNLKEMQEAGIWGRIQSTLPPNTAPAWTCALASRNPGFFGFWDNHYRGDYAYGEPDQIDCRVKDQRVECLYSLLPMLGQKVAVINLPVTWPPPRIPGGYSISGPMTPDLEKGFTWPKSLANEVQELVGEYIIDVGETGMGSPPLAEDEAIKQIYAMDGQRFTLTRHFITKRQCDCVITGITGTHRMPHLFYRFSDPEHRKYVSDSKYKTVLRDYYAWIDKQIGELRNLLDDTLLFLFSDHSVQRLNGMINLNEWLIQEGYLVLDENPSEPVPFEQLKVDWAKTKAWATGTSGQIYLNVKGREAEGIIEPENYDNLLDELISRIKAIPDDQGNAIETEVFKRTQIYAGPFADYAPDLFVFFDGCRWKTNEMVGFGPGTNYSFDTPSGQDDGADGFEGYFCLAGPGVPANGRYGGATLLDVAPTLFDLMDLDVPGDMEGVSFSGKQRTSEDEDALKQEKLKFQGY